MPSPEPRTPVWRQLPRSALLAAWGTAALTARASSDQARTVIEGIDEPHSVVFAGANPLFPGDSPAANPFDIGSDPGTLTNLIDMLRQVGSTGLRLLLPAPGDVLGLPGPAAVNTAVLEAGEGVTTVNGPAIVLCPLVEHFGSTTETGSRVSWVVHRATSEVETYPDDARETERQLRQGLTASTELLAALDTARWRPDAAALIEDVQHGIGPSDQLPPGLSPRAVNVIDLAWRVRGIVDLATEDDGGSMTSWEVDSRAKALRELAFIARRALVAAINDPLSARERAAWDSKFH